MLLIKFALHAKNALQLSVNVLIQKDKPTETWR